MPGVTLFKLAGIGTVWVTADVPEAQAGLVRVGAPVDARAAAYPERVFKGSVDALLPEMNAQTRTRPRADRARQSGRRAEARHVRDRELRRYRARTPRCSCRPRR